MTDLHPLDDALALDHLGGGRFRGRTTSAYWNMVGPYGGATAATMVRAVQSHPEVLGEPLSVTVNFAAPIAEGPFEIEAVPARTNRSNQHWTITQTQGSEVLTTATMVTGRRRDGWTDVEATRPEASPVDQAPRFGGFDGINWTQAYDLRWVEGAIPTGPEQASDVSRTTIWVRDEPARPLDFPALTALSDSFYPRAFLRRGTYVPAGTVTLTVHFLADGDEIAAHGTAHLLGTAAARRFGRGYFDQTAELWTDSGSLLATSHQLVYVKA